jgi:hypothetical protein
VPENMRMKGIYILPNAKTLDFLHGALEDLVGDEFDLISKHDAPNDGAWDDDIADESPVRILDSLEHDYGWIRVKDKYADKAYKSMHFPASTPPRPTDELRVTVLLKNGALHLDIRPWGQWNN